MAFDFNSLKADRNNLGNLMKEVEKISQPPRESRDDDRFWQPEVDKAGNGYAVIRFLPAPAGEDVPWVRIWSHAFQGPTGKWYIENSLTTLNKADPVTELNNELWNSGSEANKNVARDQKRRLTYTSNIYVVQDPAHPENEGKVFLFKYGKKIFDKIKDAMEPEFPDDAPINPFDLWKGANFKLKIRKVEGYRNYDKSEFEGAGALLQDDGELEAVWKKEYALNEFIDASQFKTYDVLKSKLTAVLSTASGPRADSIELADDDPTERRQSTQPSFKPAPARDTLDDDDDSLAYFQNMANED